MSTIRKYQIISLVLAIILSIPAVCLAHEDDFIPHIHVSHDLFFALPSIGMALCMVGIVISMRKAYRDEVKPARKSVRK